MSSKVYTLQMDGNMWMATTQDFINLQESPAGFGPTVFAALSDLVAQLDTDSKPSSLYKVCASPDQTEGRAAATNRALCVLESTALRLAKGLGVMGGPGDVSSVDVLAEPSSKVCYVSLAAVALVPPNETDMRDQRALELQRRAALELRKLGFSAQDLKDLGIPA